MVHQALQVAGHQNIHGRGGSQHKFSPSVIGARAQKIIEHSVLIGSTDQLPYGQPHLFGVVSRQNVPEISRGHHHIYGLSLCDPALPEQLPIGMDIVDNLGHQPADIDGVCRRETQTCRLHLPAQLPVRKYLLHPCLSIVKISVNAHHQGILPLLRHHLSLLDGTDPGLRVKHYDLRALHPGKSCQGRLSRVTGCGGEDDNLFLALVFPGRRQHQVGQNGQGHVLERDGGAMEQLQIPDTPRLHKRSQLLRVKLGVIRLPDTVLQFLPGEIRQKQLHHLIGSLPIIHLCQLSQAPVQGRNMIRHKQSPVLRKPLQYGLGSLHRLPHSPGTVV